MCQIQSVRHCYDNIVDSECGLELQPANMEDEHTESEIIASTQSRENVDKFEEDTKSQHQTRNDRSSSKKSKNPESFEDKKRQQLLKDCYRLKKKMTVAKNSIHPPPLKPFMPFLFNSLEPYYNQYLVNYTVNELKEEDELRTKSDYGQRSTSLGIVEPQISWKMDNVPGPFCHSRLSGNMTSPKRWASSVPGKDAGGSTRLPPFPKPSFPKINVPEYQPSRMDYSKLLKFRSEMDQEIEKINKKKTKLDYDRTLKDWERMNLTELKELPPYSRYHVSKAIKTYFGTSKGALQAVNSLSKQLEVEEA